MSLQYIHTGLFRIVRQPLPTPTPLANLVNRICPAAAVLCIMPIGLTQNNDIIGNYGLVFAVLETSNRLGGELDRLENHNHFYSGCWHHSICTSIHSRFEQANIHFLSLASSSTKEGVVHVS